MRGSFSRATQASAISCISLLMRHCLSCLSGAAASLFIDRLHHITLFLEGKLVNFSGGHSMINLQTLLIIASCVAVVFLIGLILAIAVFTKKPKAAPVPSSSDQPESGAAKTTVYCCKSCGCVVKKGTRVCPHCGAYIGPNKGRRSGNRRESSSLSISAKIRITKPKRRL